MAREKQVPRSPCQLEVELDECVAKLRVRGFLKAGTDNYQLRLILRNALLKAARRAQVRYKKVHRALTGYMPAIRVFPTTKFTDVIPELPMRLMNCCRRLRAETIQDLSAVSERQFRALWGVGADTVIVARNLLTAAGLGFNGEETS